MRPYLFALQCNSACIAHKAPRSLASIRGYVSATPKTDAQTSAAPSASGTSSRLAELSSRLKSAAEPTLDDFVRTGAPEVSRTAAKLTPGEIRRKKWDIAICRHKDPS